MAIIFRNTQGEYRRVKCSDAAIFAEKYRVSYHLDDRKQLLEWLKGLRILRKTLHRIERHRRDAIESYSPEAIKIARLIEDNYDAVDYIYREYLEQGAMFFDRSPDVYHGRLYSDWRTYQIVYMALKKHKVCGGLWAFQAVE